MIHSLLIGMVGGMRALSPLAAVSLAARFGTLPASNGAPGLLAHPVVSDGLVALAAGELAGDKLPNAPDRIVPAGLAARLMSGAVTGAALAPREQRTAAALVGAAGAVLASYLTFNARVRAMRRYGQVPTGLVEDALTLGAATLVVTNAARQQRRVRAVE